MLQLQPQWMGLYENDCCNLVASFLEPWPGEKEPLVHETYNTNDLCESTSLQCERVFGPHLERCTICASKPRFACELCGAPARKPNETQGRRFKRTPYMQPKSNAKNVKDLVP